MPSVIVCQTLKRRRSKRGYACDDDALIVSNSYGSFATMRPFETIQTRWRCNIGRYRTTASKNQQRCAILPSATGHPPDIPPVVRAEAVPHPPGASARFKIPILLVWLRHCAELF